MHFGEVIQIVTSQYLFHNDLLAPDRHDGKRTGRLCLLKQTSMDTLSKFHLKFTISIKMVLTVTQSTMNTNSI